MKWIVLASVIVLAGCVSPPPAAESTTINSLASSSTNETLPLPANLRCVGDHAWTEPGLFTGPDERPRYAQVPFGNMTHGAFAVTQLFNAGTSNAVRLVLLTDGRDGATLQVHTSLSASKTPVEPVRSAADSFLARWSNFTLQARTDAVALIRSDGVHGDGRDADGNWVYHDASNWVTSAAPGVRAKAAEALQGATVQPVANLSAGLMPGFSGMSGFVPAGDADVLLRVPEQTTGGSIDPKFNGGVEVRYGLTLRGDGQHTLRVVVVGPDPKSADAERYLRISAANVPPGAVPSAWKSWTCGPA